MDQSAPNLVKIYMDNRYRMSLIMGPIGLARRELFALELEKNAAFEFVYTLAFININQLAPNVVKVFVMAGFANIVGEMYVMPTVAYLNEIVLAVGVLSWSGRALHMASELMSSLSKGI